MRLLLTVMVPLIVPVPDKPVAVKTMGEPVSPSADALRLLDPTLGPSVQLVTAATPSAFVLTGVLGSTLPPPAVT
jgi:hypothetical protein